MQKTDFNFIMSLSFFFVKVSKYMQQARPRLNNESGAFLLKRPTKSVRKHITKFTTIVLI